MVSVLDSGAERPGFKSQSRRCRVSLRQPVHTHCASSPSSKTGSSPLKGCGGNCGPKVMAAHRRVFVTHVTCRLTAKNRDQLRNPTLGNRMWVGYLYLFTTYTLTTWHCPHSPAGRAAINRYLLQQRVCCCGPMLEQTDGDELYTVTSTLLCILCGQCQKVISMGVRTQGQMEKWMKN